MITIALVDDHRLVASALKRLLEDEGDFRVVGIESSVSDGLALVERTRPRVAILDVRIPGGRGLAEIPRFRAANPGGRIIVLTGFGEELREEALALGADVLMTKDQASAALAATLRRLVGGGTLLDDLTAREIEVARAVGAGLSNPEAGDKLGLSVNTVKTHLASAMRKLGVRDRMELALRWGAALGERS